MMKILKRALGFKKRLKSSAPRVNFLEYRILYRTSSLGERGICFSKNLASLTAMIAPTWRDIIIEGSDEGFVWHTIKKDNETF